MRAGAEMGAPTKSMTENEPPLSESDRRKNAIAWWTRLDSRTLSPREREEFAAWLTSAPANRDAFADICRFWGDLECVRPFIGELAPPPSRRAPVLRAVGFGVFAAAVAFLLFSDEIWLTLLAQTRTGVAETRALVLADGSQIELGPRSAISVDFDAEKRRVTLLTGEAWFDVAPDVVRPFSVLVGNGVITALGTSFDISTDRGRTEVSVAKHRVRVTAGAHPIEVGEGEQSSFSTGAPAVAPYPAPVDHVAAWRRGKLIFDDKPLAEVVSILGRYCHNVILILDPSLRERRVTGVFDVAQPIAGLRAIETALGLRALEFGYVILLTGG